MAVEAGGYERARGRSAAKSSIEYQLTFVVSFAFFLVATIIERLMPWTWLRHADDAQPRRSIFAKAWNSAQTCTAYAFMG